MMWARSVTRSSSALHNRGFGNTAVYSENLPHQSRQLSENNSRAMNTTAVSLYEYLHTDYSPDVDYIDGEIEERNVGEYDHANLQTLLTGYFLSHRKEWGIRVVVEQRVQVSPTRFRVPDITIITKRPELCRYRERESQCREAAAR